MMTDTEQLPIAGGSGYAVPAPRVERPHAAPDKAEPAPPPPPANDDAANDDSGAKGSPANDDEAA